jgi:hypothetical protein
MDVAGKMVGEQRGDEMNPVVATEGLEGGWSEMSMASSTRMMQWPLWLVA